MAETKPRRKHSGEELITRAYTTVFRASDKPEERGVIEGTPIVFDQATKISDWCGDFTEIIDRNALKNADLNDVRLFVNHDINKITLARSKKGNDKSTMTFTIDDVGLHMRAVLDVDNNAEARALYSAVQRGDMDGMSFMFRIKTQEWKDIDTDSPTRIIREISIVHEVSVVNFPAYPQTSVNARSSEEAEYSPLAEARKAAAEETARRENERLEIEKAKIENLFKIIL